MRGTDPTNPGGNLVTSAEFRDLMDRGGLTVTTAANLLGVSRATVQRWRHAPTLKSLAHQAAFNRLRAYVRARERAA
jgi:predicted transcriptional regulator